MRVEEITFLFNLESKKGLWHCMASLIWHCFCLINLIIDNICKHLGSQIVIIVGKPEFLNIQYKIDNLQQITTYDPFFATILLYLENWGVPP